MIYSPDINTEVVKNFLRIVYQIKQRELKRKKHRSRISGHIGRIKKVTFSKKFDKNLIEKEFEKLEKVVNEALEREKRILEEQKHGSGLVIQLRDRLNKLEKQMNVERKKRETLEQIKNALQRIHTEVKHRKKTKRKRKKREKELEGKINKKL